MIDRIRQYRQRIREGQLTPADAHALFLEAIDVNQSEEWSDPPHYDQADALLDDIVQLQPPVATLPAQLTEMIPYQTTPIRLILDMVDRLDLQPTDVVYDLGSGLGRIVFAIALLSSSQVKGVELEPSYVEYAQQCAEKLNLSRVSFITADARDVDYSDGTVFFLYTPFKGSMLRRVLTMLRSQARTRRIRVCTYGPGTLEVQDQEWLVSDDDPHRDIHYVTIFESVQVARRTSIMRRRRQR